MAGLRLSAGAGAARRASSHVANQAAGQVLRRKLAFTEDQVVEIIELVCVRTGVPFQSILKAVESLPLTPRVAEALRRLRPCITEYLGGTDMRDLHARIDLLLGGPRPDTSLEAQGAWSQTVFSGDREFAPAGCLGGSFPSYHRAEIERSPAEVAQPLRDN